MEELTSETDRQERQGQENAREPGQTQAARQTRRTQADRQ